MYNLPDFARVDIRHLREEHLERFIAVRGLIKKATEVRPKAQDAVFQCKRCGATVREPQEEHLVLREPLECYEDQGGCGRATHFILLIRPPKRSATTGASQLVDVQKLEIQEEPEGLRGGEQPQRLTAFVEMDLCGKLSPGDRVVLNGILRATPRKNGNTKSSVLDIYFDVVSFEVEEHEYEEIEITPEEEDEINRMAKQPDAFERIRTSIAPDLYGLEFETGALTLQLFGGVAKTLPSGQRLRGDIHILLVGDPGTAKSKLLGYISRLSPRSVRASGKAASGAGLTAAAVKDEFGNGRWTLEAGALVLADRGLACIDEFEKMGKEDQSSVHDALEDQCITVAKAGINATLQCRCCVLAAANPKMGRFDRYGSLAEQINLTPALLSRFDVICVIQDRPNEGRDREMAAKILSRHRGGAMLTALANNTNNGFNRASATAILEDTAGVLPSTLVRKWVAYAKRTSHPVLTPEAESRLNQYFVELRKKHPEGEGPIPLTARQLDGLVRLAEAHARLRLDHYVTPADAETAIRVVETYIRRLNAADGGVMDIDAVASGVTHSQRDRLNKIKEIIRDLTAGKDDEGATSDEIAAEAVRHGIAEDKARDALNRLRTMRQVFELRMDRWRLL